MNRDLSFSIGADVPFNRVSPKYGLKEVLASMTLLVPMLIVAVVFAIIFTADVPWLHLIWIAILAYGVISTIIVLRQARAIGYAEREDDLLIRRGIMFHKATVVPYGRLQFVDVDAGPIDRMFGLATVKLHTASAATDATIPGLPRAEADRLRDSLAGLGQANLAGL
ncbi:PH domain-containing protein [Brevibacterium spongiae]|uniref:PH domain-containing protein n=1 Tax=Brevibacterium spongiae TaxID=2909672 RepID=A0ABY5SVF4_9MICO|nr:PH domain-containing protein [Brevibacterium spongiae]UVI37074.1 PH domain-containing protein [Brevibacterium spongiae]